MNIIDDLEWRGAINQMTDEEGLRALTSEKAVFYLDDGSSKSYKFATACTLDT